MKKLSLLVCKIYITLFFASAFQLPTFAQTGTHLNFDGVNDVVNCGAPLSTFFTGFNTITVEAWVQPTSNTGLGAIMGNFYYPTTNNSMQFLLRRENSNYVFWISTTTASTFMNVTAPNAVVLNTWQHVVGVRNGNQIMIYVDGTLKATTTGTGTQNFQTPSTNTFAIGGELLGAGEYFKGNIDEVRVWSVAVPVGDILRRKNCELQGNETGLYAYYKFNQGIGGGTNSAVTTLNDASSVPHNGTLTNFALTGATSNWLAGSTVTSGVFIPVAPTVVAQSFCGSTTVASLVPAPSATIKWYSTATGGPALAGTTAIAATGTYYAAAVNANSCESIRTPVSITINTLPVVTPVTNQTICNGASTTAVNFAGTANAYSWTNNNTSVGLASSGIGNIPSFTATNTGSTAVTASLMVTPFNAQLAYVVNSGAYNVSVINTATNTVTATIPVGNNPGGISASPDGSKLYVANAGENTVSVINTATNTVINTIPFANSPGEISTNPSGSKAYVVTGGNNTVSVINTATNTVTANITVGIGPIDVSVSPDGSKVYVNNNGDNTVSVINTTTNSVIATIPVGINPWGISISADGSKVYVANSGTNTISVINTATNTVMATIPVGVNPLNVTVSPDGSKAYVANSGSNSVSVINAATNSVIATITTGFGIDIYGILISPDGSKLYVTNFSSSNVSVVNTATNTVIATIPVSSSPSGIIIANGPTCSGTPQTFTVTVNPSTDAAISTTNTTQTLPVTGITYFSNGCTDNLITKVNPMGASPISGNTTVKVWKEVTQPATPGAQFVKRHYEITPAINAATATGKITLYFTQQEFDDFNAVSTVDLPTGPADATGIANLLIEKRNGVSSDGTGLPSTYTGSLITVDPADTDIVWNASSSRWEVSFDVTGFSGFFVKTLAGVLPVQLINFTAAKQNNKVLVTWQTNNEINLNHYEVEGSIDGIHFEKLADVAANNISGTNNYSFTDNSPWVSDIRYYRLTCIENDGKFKRSEIVPVSNKKQTTVTVYPNPVTDVFTIQLGDSKLLHTQAKLVDATGKTIQSITIKTLFQNVPVVYLSNGIYILQLADGTAVKIWKN